MRDTFVKTLMGIAEQDPNVLLITGDLGFGVLKPFWERFPRQFINAGIAEQSMTGLAAGLALSGKTVFTYSIGNFPTLRCLEQIRNDCAYHNANVKIVCVGGGFTYGSLGMSHHATEDIAVMRALPNVMVACPADATQAEALTRGIYEQRGVCYLRLGRGGEAAVPAEAPQLGKAAIVNNGKQAAILFTGGIYEEVAKALELMKGKGVSPAVYCFPTVKPLDAETVRNIASRFPLIVTVEEHSIVGGFGSAVSEIVAQMAGQRAYVRRIGLNDVYTSCVGSQSYLRKQYGIDAAAITEAVTR